MVNQTKTIYHIEAGKACAAAADAIALDKTEQIYAAVNITLAIWRG